MKTCSTCGLDKPLSEYNNLKKSPDGKQARCRACCREWYEQHKDDHKKKVAKNTQDRLGWRRQWLWDFLVEHPCVDCGQKDPVLLELDHRDCSTKVQGVAQMIRSKAAWKEILAEVDKCESRCLYCHRRRTVEQFGWFNAINTHSSATFEIMRP